MSNQNGNRQGWQGSSRRGTKNLIRLRPRADSIFVTQSRTVLTTDRKGFLHAGGAHGLWCYQTRMLSRYIWTINGEQPEISVQSNVRQHSWMGYYIASPPGIKDSGHDEANPAQQTVELRLSRIVADGFHEDVDVTNYSWWPTRLTLELQFESDFADHGEVSGERKQKGDLRHKWEQTSAGVWELWIDYKVEHEYDHQGDKGVARMHRALQLRVHNAQSEPRFNGKDRIAFEIQLNPKQVWHTCLTWTPHLFDLPRPGIGIETDEKPEGDPCYAFYTVHNEWDEKRKRFMDSSTSFHVPRSEALSQNVVLALEQARQDLGSLRLFDLDIGYEGWVPAAGIPVYLALFGRDSLATAWEASLLGSEMMQGSLAALARWAGTEDNPWRDERPGKIPHEAHTGPLSVLNFSPHGLYYGGVTGSIYYPTVVSALWHWTGNKDLARRFVRPALAGLAWADRYSDFDHDGFYEYFTRSSQGEKNQGWKDSGDAIVYEDGRVVEDPLGTCEMQAFVYISKLHFSELLWWLDMKDDARRLHHEAEELKKRFNDRFWMPDLNFIAMGLDKDKRQIRSIGSDPGHCLTAGILHDDFILPVADRLMSDDMFSGWGIRTLSSDHHAYNPYAYHRGTIWPVENGAFTLGFARYGLHKKVDTLARAIFELASLFDYCRLPECLAGHQCDDLHPFPAAYPNSNWPQAWSASCVFTVLQSMLGLYPYAPMNALLLDPWLPDWLPEITLRNLRVGNARTTIRFYRLPNGTSDYEVKELRGTLHFVRQPSPWSLTADFGERVRDAIESLI